MIHIDITLEDARLVATQNGECWNVLLNDNLTGTNQIAVWSNEELWAVVTLALGNDDISSQFSKDLYEIAEPLFSTLHKELRIIP